MRLESSALFITSSAVSVGGGGGRGGGVAFGILGRERHIGFIVLLLIYFRIVLRVLLAGN
tara:strand:- start:783 stop:962 length:180 start_codon:yes stop_codon:yes gene_type:complete